jgi:uncharacterized protein (TIGR02270 family)
MLRSMVEQHAEVGAFLWHRRDAATIAPHHDMRTLCELDERVEAHVDGLRIAGDTGWEIAEAALDDGDPGSFFMAGAIAIDRGDLPAIAGLLERASADPALVRGLVAALGWLPHEAIGDILPGLLGARSPALRRIGIAACAAHRVDPGLPLVNALGDADARLRQRAIRAVGEIGRSSLWGDVRHELASSDAPCRFWAAWTGALFGAGEAIPVLRAFAIEGGGFAERAVSLAVRRLARKDAIALLTQLGRDEASARIAIAGAGALGDPVVIPWLIRWMAAPDLARVAAEAFTAVTGIPIAGKLVGPCPEGFSADELAEKDVLKDPDEKLEWPLGPAVAEVWAAKQGAYREETRYLLGEPIGPGRPEAVLKIGGQRHRAAAAIEMALSKPGTPLFEVRAPGPRQRTLLGRSA